MKTVTLAKIAEAAGVSVGTASRVISGKAKQCRISKDTVNRVKAAARKLSYSPLHIEKNLDSHKTNLIGLIIPSLKNQFFAEIAADVISEAEKHGYSVMVFDSMEDAKVLHKAVANLLDKKVEGMIVAPCGEDSMWLEQIDKMLIPVVLVDRFYEDTTLSYVATNNYKGSMLAVNHLIQAGHRNIACIQGVTSSMPNKERVAGYEQAMKEASLENNIKVIGDSFTIQNGYSSTKTLLEAEDRPTAIYTLASTIMLGSLKAIREAGYKVPDDISLVTFDNYFYLDYLEPPIIRVNQPINDICTLAVNILFKKIGKENVGVSQIRLSPTMSTGKSVKTL